MATCNMAALTPVLRTTLRMMSTSRSSQDCQHTQIWIYDSYTGNAHRSICEQIQTNLYHQLCMTSTTLLVKELLLLTKPEGRTLTVTYLLLSQLGFVGSPGREATAGIAASASRQEPGEPEHIGQKQGHENRQVPCHAFHEGFNSYSRLPKTSYLQTSLPSTVKCQSS